MAAMVSRVRPGPFRRPEAVRTGWMWVPLLQERSRFGTPVSSDTKHPDRIPEENTVFEARGLDVEAFITMAGRWRGVA